MRNLRIGIIFFIQNRTFFSFSFSLPFVRRQIEAQELASDKRLFGGFDSILPSLGRAACGVMTKRDVVIKLASTFQRGGGQAVSERPRKSTFVPRARFISPIMHYSVE